MAALIRKIILSMVMITLRSSLLRSYQTSQKQQESNSQQLLTYEKLFIPKGTSLAPDAAFPHTKVKM